MKHLDSSNILLHKTNKDYNLMVIYGNINHQQRLPKIDGWKLEHDGKLLATEGCGHGNSKLHVSTFPDLLEAQTLIGT